MIEGEIVCFDYQVIKKVGEGSYGFVYQTRHRTTHEYYALKSDEKSLTKMELENEYLTLKYLEKAGRNKKPSGIEGNICECYHFESSEEMSNMMIMPLYGENIFNLLHKCHRRLDCTTIHQVAQQMLKSIQYIHSFGVIHRDIKPQNFVVHGDKIILVDFGLAKKYLVEKDRQTEVLDPTVKGVKHVPYEIGRKIRGTPMYMSVNILLGIEPSRRDDLESLMYIVVLLLKGRLPWHNMKLSKRDFSELIKMKIATSPEELFKKLPIKLKKAFEYVRKMEFEEEPDYQFIRNSLESILQHKVIDIENQFKGQYTNFCWEYFESQDTKEMLLKQKSKDLKLKPGLNISDDQTELNREVTITFGHNQKRLRKETEKDHFDVSKKKSSQSNPFFKRFQC